MKIRHLVWHLSLAWVGVLGAEAIEWTFDRPSDVVDTVNIENRRISNGMLCGSTKWDPHFSLRLPREGVDATQLTLLTVRMYSSESADLLDVYYESPDKRWCLGGKFPVQKGWATYRLDLTKNRWRETATGNSSKQWGGPAKRVASLRLDPGNQANRWILVDWVRLEPAKPDFVEGVTAEPRGTAKLRSLKVPKSVEAGGSVSITAVFETSAPRDLERGTAYVRLLHGSTVVKLHEQPVSYKDATLNLSVNLPVSRYWNPGKLTVEVGCYELDTSPDAGPLSAEVAFVNKAIRKAKPPVCELRRVGGDPSIFVNGKPMEGYTFLVAGGLHPEYHREAAQAGVHLYTDWFGTSRYSDMGHVAPDKYDYSEFDRYFAAILDIDPDAWFLPHIGVSGPLWWQTAHPEEMSLREDGKREPTSFASEVWKREMGEDLRKLIAYLRQSPYADRIIGYIVYSGYTAEWQMWGTWQASRDDYSQPALKAFRSFLRNRYSSDEKLKAAWADEKVTLASAEMPLWAKRRPPGNQILRDPKTERQAMDFYEFISNMTADGILHFARIAREATGGKALVGTYYAYLSAHGVNQQDSGHLAARRVYDSPDIDFLMSPPNYAFRKPGETSTFMSATDSFRMRGKLWLDESDHRTFLTDTSSGYGRAENLEDTRGVFWREFAEVLTKRAAVSWFDMSGGWFSHPQLLADLGKAAQIMKSSLVRRKKFAPEIGVFVDPESFYWMRSTLANAGLVLSQITTLPQSGAPWDFCLLSDIGDSRLPDYKFYIFLNSFRVDESLREAITRKLKRNNATALFLYAPGYFMPNGPSLENMRALTGIRIAKEDTEAPAQIVLEDGSKEPVGMKRLTLSPVFYADDPDAKVLGRLVGNHCPGLVVKKQDGWTSMYSAAMPLPPFLMRNIARQAGVHIWVESDDALYTDGEFVGVHAATAGTKRICLPARCKALEVIDGKPLSVEDCSIDVSLKRGETTLISLKH